MMVMESAPREVREHERRRRSPPPSRPRSRSPPFRRQRSLPNVYKHYQRKENVGAERDAAAT
jgi:hypothetical protein